MSSSQLIFIFFKMVKTTNQFNMVQYGLMMCNGISTVGFVRNMMISWKFSGISWLHHPYILVSNPMLFPSRYDHQYFPTRDHQ